MAVEKMLDKSWETKPLVEVIRTSPAALQGLTDKDAALLLEALGVKTIEDLATCKFVLWAQALVTLARVEKGGAWKA